MVLPIHLRGLSRNYPLLDKEKKTGISKLTSKRATLLDYSDEGLALQAELSSAPLEGFATHAVDASINEFMKDAKSDV